MSVTYGDDTWAENLETCLWENRSFQSRCRWVWVVRCTCLELGRRTHIHSSPFYKRPHRSLRPVSACVTMQTGQANAPTNGQTAMSLPWSCFYDVPQLATLYGHEHRLEPWSRTRPDFDIYDTAIRGGCKHVRPNRGPTKIFIGQRMSATLRHVATFKGLHSSEFRKPYLKSDNSSNTASSCNAEFMTNFCTLVVRDICVSIESLIEIFCESPTLLLNKA